MGNKHTFIGVSHTFNDVSAYSTTRPITHDPDENFDEGVLIPHNAYIRSIQNFRRCEYRCGPVLIEQLTNSP